MKIVTGIKEMQKISLALKRKGKKIGFVPTMGALHQGHLSLVRASQKECDATVVSIFVNPLQFGPKEDFKKYPRTFTADKRILKRAGVEYLFYPTAVKLYEKDFSVRVEETALSNFLCGAHRKGHFRGVATVVLKLFHCVLPDRAYFGRKDYQQAMIIKKMIRDLNIPLSKLHRA